MRWRGISLQRTPSVSLREILIAALKKNNTGSFSDIFGLFLKKSRFILYSGCGEICPIIVLKKPQHFTFPEGNQSRLNRAGFCHVNIPFSP
jgi:hypothetical protein